MLIKIQQNSSHQIDEIDKTVNEVQGSTMCKCSGTMCTCSGG